MTLKHLFPTSKPILNLDFANSLSLDPRITFTRSTIGTYVDKDGIVQTAAADEPRFDYDPETGESLGLLVEESRTNKIGTSEDTNVMNSQTNCSVTTDALISPDGSLTADTITFTSAGNLSTSSNNIAIAGSIWTWSVFLKAGTVSEVTIDFNGRAAADVNLSLGTIDQPGSSGGAGAEIKELSNGWYRASITYDATSSINRGIRIISGNSGTLHCWGIMVEEGSFPTSYIPTSGTGLVRSPDIAQMTGDNFSSWYAGDQTTFFVEGGFNHTPPRDAPIFCYGGAQLRAFPDNRLNTVIGGVTEFATLNVSDWKAYKCAFYLGTDGDQNLAVDGVTKPTTITNVWDGFDTYNNLTFSSNNNSLFPNGTISRLAAYNQRLTDAELQTITL